MKIKKLSSQALRDIEDMAQSLPTIWIGRAVTKSVSGEYLMLCNIPIPDEFKNFFGDVNKSDRFDMTYDDYEIVTPSGHQSKMLNLVKKAKNEAAASEAIAWYVGKQIKIQNAQTNEQNG